MSESHNQAAGPGRLAQVIATRGGLAPPEAPFVIEHREALIYMLCEAAEVEHGIMCQYLYAAFSLKQSAGLGLCLQQLQDIASGDVAQHAALGGHDERSPVDGPARRLTRTRPGRSSMPPAASGTPPDPGTVPAR